MRSHSVDGLLNETAILVLLDKHYFKDLSDKWKRHMRKMYKNIKDDDLINVTHYHFKDEKPDLEIEVNGKKKYLSVKSGHAPTMHYEPIKTFFEFLREYNVPERIIRIISFYHYGYSINKDHYMPALSREEILNKYSNYIKEVNDYFASREDLLIEIAYRSIIRGRNKGELIDYFYYGNTAKGYLLSKDEILQMILHTNNNTLKTLCFKPLTYVSCARDIKNPRRHNIKINWPILCKYFYDEDFLKIYG